MREVTVAAFEARRQELRQSGHQAMERVQRLTREQAALAQTLGDDLSALGQRGQAMQLLDAQGEVGLLANLVRAFTGNKRALARKSVMAALIAQYETVQKALRRATALADELRLCAVELQAQVDALHDSEASARDEAARVAQTLMRLEDRLESVTDARERDRLDFEIRQEGTKLALLEGMEALSKQQLEPARQLRDTMQLLHAETAKVVLEAAGRVNEAGRHVQALGAAADAPLVVADLQEALARLDDTMSDSRSVAELANDMVSRTLPELDARLAAADEMRQLELEAVDRSRAHRLAEQALRRAAQAEVDAL